MEILTQQQGYVGSLAIGNKQTIAVDPPNITAGAIASVAVTVPGAVSGQFVLVQPPSALETGLVLVSASVTANDTVTLRLYNPTAGAIDGTSRNWTFLLIG